MKTTDEIVDESKNFPQIEFGGQMYFCTEEPWFDRFDDAYYWWKAAAVDSEGDDYVVQWAFDDDYRGTPDLPWDDVYSVDPE